MSQTIEKIKAWVKISCGLLKNPGVLTSSFGDFQFLSDRETLRYLKENDVGIARFGSAELAHLAERSHGFQAYDARLKRKLVRILSIEQKNVLVGLPLDLILGGEYEKRGASARLWRTPKYAVLPFLKRNQVYGSPFCFWLWNRRDDDAEEYVQLALSLFEGKNIIYMGDEGNIAKIRNILRPRACVVVPSKNAFDSYEKLMSEAIRISKNYTNPLVLISAGMTATVLSAELNSRGILTYDVGQFANKF